MREKLIALIDDNKACDREIACCECEYCDITPCFAVRMADALIAHGVTFAEDTNVPRKVEKLQKQIKALEKSNRNWRRKCQRLRTQIETTENEI